MLFKIQSFHEVSTKMPHFMEKQFITPKVSTKMPSSVEKTPQNKTNPQE